MQVVILCGGKGTRLGDVTGNLVPKPMALVGDKPILLHIMEKYAREGFDRFILCAGHLSWVIKDYFIQIQQRQSDIRIKLSGSNSVEVLSRHSPLSWEIIIAETGLESGTAGRIKKIEKYLDGRQFMLTYGDGLSDVKLKEIEAFHKNHGKLVTMTGVVPPGRFGELAIEGDRVVQMQEKPQVSDRYINGGFMLLKRDFVDRFIALKADDTMLEREPLAEAAAAGELMLFKHERFWQCMDTARDWSYLNELSSNGRAPWLD
jgi:glucose-1-phosphate cytidylyltransferase